MELPIEIQRLIHEFALPITRPDWRNGSYINMNLANHPYCEIRDKLKHSYILCDIINYSNDDSQFKSCNTIIPNKIYKGCNYHRGGGFF